MLKCNPPVKGLIVKKANTEYTKSDPFPKILKKIKSIKSLEASFIITSKEYFNLILSKDERQTLFQSNL